MDFTRYLVTGATGFLGRAVVSALREKGAEIRALVLPGDPQADLLPNGVEIIRGDVSAISSLVPFFSDTDRRSCVIHCAGLVSVASRQDLKLYRVNVNGTDNILWWCRHAPVGRLVCVSSVHAFPVLSRKAVITEDTPLLPEYVREGYARSKSISASRVLEAARQGLNACVVYPSGLIGPGDTGKSSLTQMLLSFLSGRLPLAVDGGYDFADVRDAAAGIAACAERGLPGEGYILSGEYLSLRALLDTVREAAGLRRRTHFLPVWAARIAAPLYERRCIRKNLPLFFTPDAVEALAFRGSFSHLAASRTLGYAPRPVRDSIRDTVQWLLADSGKGP